MEIVSGDAQSGVVGQELSAPVAIRVVDANGNPVQGQLVNFRITEGGGSVFAGSASTNADGVARERWTLGTIAGVNQTLEARAVDPTSGERLVFATFHATAKPDVPAALVITTQPGGTARSGQALATQPAVRLADKYGNAVPLSGMQVTASVTAPANDRTLSGTSSIATDNAGVATFTNLAVVGGVGSVTLSFAATGLTETTSSAITLTAGTPSQFAAVGPTSFTGTVGTELTALPAVVVRDAANNAVAGVTVIFSASDGAGPIAPTSAITDANGKAALTSWTLPHQAGTYQVVASASAIAGSSATFSAVAVAASAASIARTDQTDIAGTVATALSALSFRVSDSFGNPVAGATVSFAVTAPGASVSTGGAAATTASGVSDATGLVVVTWTLGTTIGTQTLTASSGAATLSVAASARSASASRVVLRQQPNGEIASGHSFAQQPIAALVDQYGNSVAQAGTVVTASVSNGDNLTGTTTATTDATGAATFTDLGITGPAGSATLTFSAPSLTSATSVVQVTVGQATSMVAASPLSVADTILARIAESQLPAVVLKDAGGTPVPNVAVAFRVAGEGGLIAGSSGALTNAIVTVFSDATGTAKLSAWQLSNHVGTGTVTATAVDLGFQVVFTANVSNGNAAALAIVKAPSGTVQYGVAFPQQPAIALRDQAGNPVPRAGVTVTASVTSPYAINGGATASTDASGVATFTGLSATGPNGSFALTFSASAIQSTGATLTMQSAPGTPGLLASLLPLGGAQQSAVVAKRLQLSVEAVDAAGVAVPNVTVSWAITSGGGTLTGSPSTTSASGIAVATLMTPNQPGTVVVQASAPGSPSVQPATFTIAVAPGRPCSYSFENTQQTAQRGEPLPLPLVLTTKDSLGNVIPQYHLSLSWDYTQITSHDVPGTVQILPSDASDPKTYYQVTLGSHIGTQALTYTYSTCPIFGSSIIQTGSAGIFTATDTPPATLKLTDGVTLAGKMGDTLGISVLAFDSHGFPANAILTYTVTGTDGAVYVGYSGTPGISATTGVSPDAPYAWVYYIVGASSSQQLTVSTPGVTPLVLQIQRNP